MKYQVQCMSIQSGQMILGSLSQFYMYGLTSLDQPPLSKPGYYTDLPTVAMGVICQHIHCYLTLLTFDSELINTEDLSLGFIRLNELDAINCIEISGGREYLLCFHCKSIDS